ncbi:hypothetical protein R1flu_019560 [Riccia fluitans]|uniref:Septum formation inhibitor MinC C-terminal domain-containing protein n=1 Tax=Riccia fluitans TaxID=41844 RepID=A0ABD1ZJC0_9MARC
MASRLLTESIGGSIAVTEPRIFVTTSLHSHEGKRHGVARGESFQIIRKVYVPGPRMRLRRIGLPGNQVVIQGDSVNGSSDSGLERRKHSEACRSLSSDGVDRGESSSGQIREKLGAGGEIQSECLYVKRSIGDAELVEHSGSVIVLGDVKQGAYVSAGGDVVVLGRLQGTVQAGRSGNYSAKIFFSCNGSGTIRIGEEATLQLVDDGSYFPRVAELAPNPCRILIRPGIGDLHLGGNFSEKQSTLAEGNKKEVDFAAQPRGTHSSNAAQVALFTGIYISVAGLLLFSFPKLFGILFDLQHVSLGWIQVGAVLAVVFGVYYIGTAVGDMRGIQGAQAFYYSTVVGRTFLFFSFTWLVITGAVPSPLLVVGFINLLGAGLMWRALIGTQKQAGN